MKQLLATNFYLKSCNLGLTKCFDAKVITQKFLVPICMKFSGFMCLGM